MPNLNASRQLCDDKMKSFAPTVLDVIAAWPRKARLNPDHRLAFVLAGFVREFIPWAIGGVAFGLAVFGIALLPNPLSLSPALRWLILVFIAGICMCIGLIQGLGSVFADLRGYRTGKFDSQRRL